MEKYEAFWLMKNKKNFFGTKLEIWRQENSEQIK